MAAVQDEVWTPHVLEDAVERERLEPLDGVRHRLDAEHPLDVAGQAMPLVGVLPELVYRPDRAVETQAASRGSREAARAA